LATVPTIDLIAALEATTLGNPTRIELAKRIFADALEHADLDAALTLAKLLDADPALDAALLPHFDSALHSQPDAVYRFVRARLAAGADERWRFRLRQAALAALHIAITDADPDTVLSWLTLIAREPISYDLGEVLHHGLLAAQTRAGEDERLARGIILIALKRDTAALNQLIADAAIRAALPAELGALLCGGECDALAVLGAFGSDIFLAALARAADEKRGAVFTIPVLDQLWHFYSGGAGGTLPAALQPAHIVTLWVADASWLPAPTFDHLLALALRDGRDTLTTTLIRQIVITQDSPMRLAGSLRKSGIAPNAIVNLLGKLTADAILAPGDASRLLELLIERMGWDASAQPLVHLWGRLNKGVNGNVPDDEHLWLMLEYATSPAHADELAARVASRCLTTRIERLEDDERLIETIRRLWGYVEALPELRGELLDWWRRTMLALPIARLHTLGQSLSAHEPLEDASAVIETIQATRRLLGKRTLAQFAGDVHTTLALLQSLLDAFDGENKRALRFDPLTIRAELERQDAPLSDQEYHIFSSDLKDLAHLIGVLGDHRSKPNLIRREEEIDRQIMQGDQEPHGGVDVLKWMSGYLDGQQDEYDDDQGEVIL
jgi:hypothetical protein